MKKHGDVYLKSYSFLDKTGNPRLSATLRSGVIL